jgi:hypothetical protein
MCEHHHRHRGWRRFGRIPSVDELLRILEEKQRDLEQETADVAELIRRLREGQPAETASV